MTANTSPAKTLGDDRPTPGKGVTTSGAPYGRPDNCIGCGNAIDRGDDYLALIPTNRNPKLIAAAHHAKWVGPRDDYYDHRGPDTLQSRWTDTLTGTAERLHLGTDHGGPRFYVGRTPFHARQPSKPSAPPGPGSPPDGSSTPPAPGAGRHAYLHLDLAGYDPYPVPLTLHDNIIVCVG